MHPQTAIRALGFPIKKEEARRLMQQYDTEQRGKIDYSDFVEISKLGCSLALNSAFFCVCGWYASLSFVYLCVAVTHKYNERDPEEEIRRVRRLSNQTVYWSF